MDVGPEFQEGCTDYGYRYPLLPVPWRDGTRCTVQETEEELRRVLAENEVLKGLLADSMAANSSQSRTGMTQANGHPPDSALKSPPSHHFCVSSWLSFFSEV